MNISSTPHDVLTSATGSESVEDAVAWIEEGHHLQAGADIHDVLGALLALGQPVPQLRGAIARLAREVAGSNIDTAQVLLEVDTVHRPEHYRAALDTLARKSEGRTLERIDGDAFFFAQRDNPLCVEVLCAIAGITYNNLKSWASARLPERPSDNWTRAQARAAFEVIDQTLRNPPDPELPGARYPQPIELLFASEETGAWESAERMRTGGVTYEVLLAQRTVGSAWTQHRNSTSQLLSATLARKLGQALDGRGVDHHLTSKYGGDLSAAGMQHLTGVASHIGLVAVDRHGDGVFAVAFSVANDGGTARNNARRIKEMADARIPVAVVVAGQGWAGRNETAELVEIFGGHVYSERDVTRLADAIQEASRQARNRS